MQAIQKQPESGECAVLPVLPSVLSRVLELDQKGGDTFDGLLELAEADPCFAVRVLQLANTAWYARRGAPRTMRQAITNLGSKATTELLLALSVQEVFVPTRASEKALWLHAIQTALASRAMARIWPEKVDPEEAYLAGLLHDVGRFLLFQTRREDLARVDESGWASPRELVELEQRKLGTTHAELGEQAMIAWALPERLIRFVGVHHEPHLHKVDADIRELTALVQQADRLSVAMLTKAPGPSWEGRVAEASLLKHREQQLPPREVGHLVAVVERRSAEMVRGLSVS